VDNNKKFMNLRKIWIALCLMSTIWTQQALAESFSPFVVKDIQVIGLKRVSLGATLIHLPIKIGDTVDGLKVQAAIRALYKTTNFDGIKIENQGNTIVIRVQERPMITQISFEGNSDIKEEMLQDILDGNMIKEGEPLDRSQISAIEMSLQEFYYSQGKYNAQVTAEIIELPRNRVELNFNFIEGDAAEIIQINFTGNTVFSDEELQEQIQLKDDVAWWNFFSNQQYQKQKLEADIETIKTYYHNHGYIRFKLNSTQVSISQDMKFVYVTMNISEGEQYSISEVRLIGNLLNQKEQLQQKVTVKAGDLYTAAAVTESQTQIKKHFSSQGYARPMVKTIPDINDVDKTVVINMNVNPGNRVYVRKVHIQGNDKTKDAVIRREIRQLEGAWYNESKLELSKFRLLRLGIFDNVDTRIVSTTEAENYIDIIVEIKEKRTASINLQFGLGSNTGFSIGAGVTDPNFLGTGHNVSVNVNYDQIRQVARLSWTDPYFTSSGLSLGAHAQYNRYSGSKSGTSDYTSDTYGLGVNSGFALGERTRLDFNLDYLYQMVRQNKFHVESDRFYQIYGVNSEAGIDVNEFDIGSTWSYNSRNGVIFPTDGMKHLIKGVMSLPTSKIQYFKLMYKGEYYFPLTSQNQWVFVLRNQFMYGNGYGTYHGEDGDQDHILPFWEYYTAGGQVRTGEVLLRGFQSDTAGPRRYSSLNPAMPGAPIAGGSSDAILGYENNYNMSNSGMGGNAMMYASAELVFPIPFVKDTYQTNFRASLFLDVGSVWNTEFVKSSPGVQQSELDKIPDYSDPWRIRASLGVNVSYMSPIGMLSFYIAKPFVYHEEDLVDSWTPRFVISSQL
jgi:outer membrane protein insertion porin family